MRHIGDILICIDCYGEFTERKGNCPERIQWKIGKVEFPNDGYLLNDYVEQLDILFSDINGLINEF